LIYICELSQVNPFDYLTALLRNFDQLAREPALWMPWNYSDALAGPAPVSAA
jgi:transposase